MPGSTLAFSSLGITRYLHKRCSTMQQEPEFMDYNAKKIYEKAL
jgi:heat shock protein HslJ